LGKRVNNWYRNWEAGHGFKQYFHSLEDSLWKYCLPFTGDGGVDSGKKKLTQGNNLKVGVLNGGIMATSVPPLRNS
jgi:hypothetical protein